MTLLLLLILYLLFTNPQLVAEEVLYATNLWWMVLVPVMYPSFVVIDMIEQMPLIQKISRLLYPLFKTIFRIHSPKSTFLILMSFLCGAPASTKLIESAYIQNEISQQEYQNLICAFSNLSMPYILMILSKNGLLSIMYYVIFLFLAILWMQIFNHEKSHFQMSTFTKPNFKNSFFESIQKNIRILFNILGILIIFRVLIHLIFKNEPLFYPYLEILGGLNQMKNPLIIYSSLGFLGFSLHVQIISIANELSYPKFLCSRIYFSLVGILAFL